LRTIFKTTGKLKTGDRPKRVTGTDEAATADNKATTGHVHRVDYVFTNSYDNILLRNKVDFVGRYAYVSRCRSYG